MFGRTLRPDLRSENTSVEINGVASAMSREGREGTAPRAPRKSERGASSHPGFFLQGRNGPSSLRGEASGQGPPESCSASRRGGARKLPSSCVVLWPGFLARQKGQRQPR